MLERKTVAFYNKGSEPDNILKWEKKLKKWYKNFDLVPLESEIANKADIALVWKPPMKKILDLSNLNSIICLGQGVDHIINYNKLPKNLSVYRIVDPYMAKSMSHWVILSILNYIRDYDGYRSQQKNKIFKSRDFIDFQSTKIGVYGLGEIGNVVAKDLSLLGFEVLGWSRTKKINKLFKTFYNEKGFEKVLREVDIHVCLLPLTMDTEKIFNFYSFSKMKDKVCFINAGRGKHVDEKDLLAFSKNKIKLAILDVFCDEPLKKNHPFWLKKNIIIWPHVSAETNVDTAAEQIAKAIRLIHSKKIPENKINLNIGY